MKCMYNKSAWRERQAYVPPLGNNWAFSRLQDLGKLGVCGGVEVGREEGSSCQSLRHFQDPRVFL